MLTPKNTNEVPKSSEKRNLYVYTIIMHHRTTSTTGYLEELEQPLLTYIWSLRNAILNAFVLHLNWWTCHRIHVSLPFNMTFIILVCALHYAMIECCFPFLSGICFFTVGSGVDVSNESETVIDNIGASYKYINEQEQGKRTFSFEAYLIPFSSKCFESPPDIICIRFNCLLSIDRVTYVDACLPCYLYILIQCS